MQNGVDGEAREVGTEEFRSLEGVPCFAVLGVEGLHFRLWGVRDCKGGM